MVTAVQSRFEMRRNWEGIMASGPMQRYGRNVLMGVQQSVLNNLLLDMIFYKNSISVFAPNSPQSRIFLQLLCPLLEGQYQLQIGNRR